MPHPIRQGGSVSASQLLFIQDRILVDDVHLKILRLLEADPTLSQRSLARQLGISLGKTHYCLRALIDKGWIEIQNFRNSQNKRAYAYLITPRGIEQKTSIAVRFLKHKQVEYERLREEIGSLQREVNGRVSESGE